MTQRNNAHVPDVVEKSTVDKTATLQSIKATDLIPREPDFSVPGGMTQPYTTEDKYAEIAWLFVQAPRASNKIGEQPNTLGQPCNPGNSTGIHYVYIVITDDGHRDF